MATPTNTESVPKRWIGVLVSKEASNTLKRVLRASNVRYEPSSCGDDVHFEILTTEDAMPNLMASAGLSWEP